MAAIGFLFVRVPCQTRPRKAYDYICKVLQDKQTSIEDVFFLQDQRLPLVRNLEDMNL